MSYRIVYGRDKKRYRVPQKPWKKPVICLFVAMCAIVLCHISGLAGALWRFLLPGDPAVTEAALLNMVENISDGASLSDSVTAFCQQIYYAAQVP